MGRSVVTHPLTELPDEERRRVLLRELDVHGGSPSAVARSIDTTVVSVQEWLSDLGLRGAAKRARDRWARMFNLGGKDTGG